MQSKPNLLLRDDTFFGVCEALGEDLGFHANWLRAALAVLLLYNPLAAIGAYAAAGAVVAFSRLVVRSRRPATVAAPAEAEQVALHADNETIAEMMAAAA
jgi:phage shock protein PspC (stress-responsive transcriptional regulator)